ncbi:hypothetical protein GCM10025777_58840 [Membranihabitans marinus]
MEAEIHRLISFQERIQRNTSKLYYFVLNQILAKVYIFLIQAKISLYIDMFRTEVRLPIFFLSNGIYAQSNGDYSADVERYNP